MNSKPRISSQDGALEKGYDMENKPALQIVQLITTRNVEWRQKNLETTFQKVALKNGGADSTSIYNNRLTLELMQKEINKKGRAITDPALSV